MRTTALLSLLLIGGRPTPVVSAAARSAAESNQPTSVDFATDVLPVVTRAGCNAGGCHGGAKGQAGFKLSLMGYDVDADFEAIAMELHSRRINRADPEESLLLRKASMKTKHGGGRALAPDSDEYRTVLAWIKAGAPKKTRDLTLTRVDVTPASAVLKPGEELSLKVTAAYSDGTTRDQTKLALYSTNDESIAAVSNAGIVKLLRAGETAVIVKFGGHVVPVMTGGSFGKRPDFATANVVDELLLKKWTALGIAPAARADDAVFLRRAHLDVIGTLPTPDEVRAFLAKPDRVKLIDALLARPEFETFWTLKLSQWLLVGAQKFPPSYPAWLRANLDAPLPEMAKKLVTASGAEAPAAFFNVSSDPRVMMEFTVQTFHGFRMQCANCHNHPLERYPQDDYHALAATYARLRRDGGRLVTIERGDLVNPRTGRNAVPRFDGADRRVAFADWLVTDRAFARAWANRLWGEIFGRGLVHPVDDIRASNPASVPELLEALTDLFAKTPRIRPTLRLLLTSHAYGISSINDADDRFFARAIVKPLPAEVVLDAIATATGTLQDRAIERFDPSSATPVLNALGRCSRQSICTLASEFNGSLRQALTLVGLPDTSKARQWDLDELYLRALGRLPGEKERVIKADREDLLWALLLSKEFQFRH